MATSASAIAASQPDAITMRRISDAQRTAGATIRRTIWDFQQVTATVRAFRAVIHDGKTPAEAALAAGI